MLKLLRSLVSPRQPLVAQEISRAAPLPSTLSAPGAPNFDVVGNFIDANSLPVLNWEAAQRWIESIPLAPDQATAWSECELAWLEHLCEALGPHYQLREKDGALVLSTLEGNVTEATLNFMNKTVKNITRLLDGVAQVPEWGHDILIVFDDDDAYYSYVAHYYPEAGEFAASGGMYINSGCGHFATVKADLRSIEPVIAHEMTHGCLGHLPIPAWLNEGIAVNTERRLCPPSSSVSTPQQMHARHCKFWGTPEIQEFWSGRSFLRPDEGNELSYDLARIIVSQFAADWDRFRPFVLSADVEDGGAVAAGEHLGIQLGDVISALLEKRTSYDWAPNPAMWSDAPERGAFCEYADLPKLQV